MLINILLGQKGRLLRDALAAALSREEDLHVVTGLGRGDEILPAAQRERPHIVLLDGALPGTMPTFELCKTLLTALPECGMLVMMDPPSSAATFGDLARLAPRVGLIGTESSPADLVDGVRRLARGEPVLDTEVAVAALTAEENPLTDREREVLRLALDGAPAKDIAKSLFLSAGTVRNHLSRILDKTGARSRIEAIRIAHDAGWI